MAAVALTPDPTPPGRGESWVAREGGGREEVLPDKLARSMGVFFGKGVGKIDLTKASREVFFVKQAHTLDLTTQVGDDGLGEGNDAILFPFAIAHGDGLVFESDVLDAQTDAFHQAQARAIEQLCHEFVGAVELGDDAQDLVTGEDGREAFGAFGGGGEDDGLEVFVEDFGRGRGWRRGPGFGWRRRCFFGRRGG